jgi:hypothetical protein
MKCYVIKSNHGNQSGFNRKWELIDECYSIKEAKNVLRDLAFNCSDDIIERNRAPFDTKTHEYLYTKNDTSFEYDGYKYVIITRKDVVDRMIFNGGSMGYQPNFIEF